MTGPEIINRYCEAVNELFIANSFQLNVIFSSVRNPCYKTFGQTKAIHLPLAIEDLDFDSSNTKGEFLILIALSHETAHYFYNHTKINNPELDKAVEIWADFYGGKIIFTLFLYNDFFKSKYLFFKDPKTLIKNYYEGLCEVYNHYYLPAIGKKYPTKELRMQVGLAAMTSVFSKFTKSLHNPYSFIAVKEFEKNWNFNEDKYNATEPEILNMISKIEMAHSMVNEEAEFILKHLKQEFLDILYYKK